MWFQVDECKGKIAPWMRPVRSLDATEVRSVRGGFELAKMFMPLPERGVC
jgi:hypothetical protein